MKIEIETKDFDLIHVNFGDSSACVSLVLRNKAYDMSCFVDMDAASVDKLIKALTKAKKAYKAR